ncbi:MAG TPA: tetratricopeptide repeat protein [Gemmatimonadales bacterium]|nr:tetratricopeptide repeat protein [Gemmatimonadales bacterium]
MPRALTTSTLGLTAVALAALLSACDRKASELETASAVTTDTAAGTWKENKGAIAITTSSDAARKLYLEGRSLSEQLRAHDGRQLYQQAAEQDPSFAMAHYQLAVNSATAKDFFDHMNRAVALSDKVSEGERLMILALQAGGNANAAKALEYQKELVAKYPDDERAHFLLGNGHFGQQHYEEAIEEYRKAIEINPKFSGAYNSIGYAYRPLEKYVDAEVAFKKYIELIPNDPNPYDSYAELLMKAGRFEESIAQYRKALEVDPHFTNSRVGIATNLMYQGKHAEGAKLMDELYGAARDDGDRRFALFAKGVILVDAGRTDAAVREIEKEYALDTKLGDPANMSGDAQLLGNILLDAGRTDAAAKKFAQALSVVEQSSLSNDVKEDTRLANRYNVARVALAGGDLAKAKSEAKAYESGAQARQNSFRIRQGHELLGTIALKEKQYDEAIAHFDQGNQQDPQVIYWTALAWQGKGDAPKAKALAIKASKANVLPLASYAFVRTKAAKMAG